MAQTQQSVLLDAPKEVDIPAIERELASLWKHASEDSSSDGAPVVRACSVNLVIFAEAGHRSSGLEEIISQITVDHPSRIFLISVDRSADMSSIEAWVSARCSLPVPGGKQVCCEEINFVVGGTESEKIPSMVTSLLVPDIPTILIWKSPLDQRGSVLEQLAQISDRVLIDSSEELHPEASLIGWCDFIQEHGGPIALGDLAWTHVTPWRTLLARTFQPAEARLHLMAIDSATIEYTSTIEPLHSGLSQAFLAIAWLAHALEWVLVYPFKEKESGMFDAKFKREGHDIIVHILRVPSHRMLPGKIESITLHSARGGEISLRAMDREDCMRVHCSLSGVALGETVQSIHHQSEAELVSKELEVFLNDSLFESSMAALKSMLANRNG